MCSRCIIQIILLASLIVGSEARAEYSLRIVTSSPASVYQQTAQTLSDALRNSHSHIAIEQQVLPKGVPNDKGLTPNYAIPHPDWQVAIGSKACENLLRHTRETATLCAFITAAAFKQLLQKYPERDRVHGLCIDQPLPRLIRLATLLHSEQPNHRIGLLSTDNESETAIASDKVELHITQLGIDDNPIQQLKPLVSNNDSVIVLPGNSHLNRLSARLILQLSLKHKTPVIGFSKKYTDAGALLSIHPSPEDIALDITRILESKPDSAATPTLQPGSNFSLSMNKNVARKLRYQLDMETLRKSLDTQHSGL
ncbi:MAG: hypothetical protein AseanaTS_29330 [Candidatus Pelagadaptatus aseana]|uniref:hypothetical protein n=1 Tax=Candidatus Pelagadaptatus aseana TaxID=3120508 RepID=UPI0039B20BA7